MIIDPIMAAVELIDSLGMWDMFLTLFACMLALRILRHVLRQMRSDEYIGPISPSINWSEIRTGRYQNYSVSDDEWDNDDEETEDEEIQPIQEPDELVLICSYCKRPNLLTALECEKCGAPLTNRKRASA